MMARPYATKRLHVPARAHPLIKELYQRIIDKGLRVRDVSDRVEIGYSTICDWRNGRCPNLMTFEDCLNAVGYKLVIQELE